MSCIPLYKEFMTFMFLVGSANLLKTIITDLPDFFLSQVLFYSRSCCIYMF